MYVIVEINGQQFKVEKDSKIFVHRLDAEDGAVVDFDKVLLVDNEGRYRRAAAPHHRDVQRLPNLKVIYLSPILRNAALVV